LDVTSLDYYEWLGQSVESLGDHVTKLHAVLGIDESEVTDLIAALDDLDALDTWTDTTGGGTVPVLRLANLSRLFRWAEVGRVLGMNPTDALRFAEILGVAPGYNTSSSTIDEGLFATPALALQFLEDVGKWQAAGWSVDEI